MIREYLRRYCGRSASGCDIDIAEALDRNAIDLCLVERTRCERGLGRADRGRYKYGTIEAAHAGWSGDGRYAERYLDEESLRMVAYIRERKAARHRRICDDVELIGQREGARDGLSAFRNEAATRAARERHRNGMRIARNPKGQRHARRHRRHARLDSIRKQTKRERQSHHSADEEALVFPSLCGARSAATLRVG